MTQEVESRTAGRRVITFLAEVRRGPHRGMVLVPWLDPHDNMAMLPPDGRVDGNVYAARCVRVRSCVEAKRLIEQHGYSMRMFLPVMCPEPRMISPGSIRVVEFRV